jgi:hypothetical protein
LKSKATIRNVSIVYRAIAYAEPSSYTTYSVVEAPEKDEQLRLKHENCVEQNLRELLLESSIDGTVC